jgi:flagellar basal body L-ring protein FlgH
MFTKPSRLMWRCLVASGLMVATVLTGCRTAAPPQAEATNRANEALQQRQNQLANDPLRQSRRRPVNPDSNAYEGSLWTHESSFGNLFRDHRARFRGDLFSIRELSAIVSVPPPKQATQDTTTPEGQANIALEAMTLRDQIEEEQNGILRSLDIISARVVRVLSDGNMLIQGQKIDYRQRNQVRYITTVTGVLRPADVDDSNIVSATKLANPNVQIKRQQSSSLIRERLEQLSPLAGQQQSNLAGRLSDFASGGQ